MPAAIEVTEISKRFGALLALDRVSLSIKQGEFFGLLGPNGAGKTTLISVLAGLARQDSGTARIMGYDVRGEYRPARRALGVVPQELVFDPFFTVRETLQIQSGYFGLRANDGWIDEIMANLDLTGKAEVNMRSLSGGMKRRVLVAQALVHRPPVIVLDEPTAGVDVELRQGLWKFIRRLNEAGHTIVLTTHYLEEAEALCGRIAMLKSGRIVAMDSRENLFRHHHSLRLRIRISGKLPECLRASDKGTDGEHLLTLDGYSDLEPTLAKLRADGNEILEMELLQPDLEDIFLEIMRKGDHAQDSADAPAIATTRSSASILKA